MNSEETINVINYIDSSGLITSSEFDSQILDYPISKQAFILIIAQILKRKSNAQLRSLTHDVYRNYVSYDNSKIQQVFKHIMIIYQRSQRQTKLHYYLKWLSYSNKPDDKQCEHFSFMIGREDPHERLFNYYKNKELILNKLEHMYSADEAEKCTFMPMVNQCVINSKKYLPMTSRSRTNFGLRSISEERDYDNHRNPYISNNKQSISLSTTHSNSHLHYTSLLSNKSHTIDYSDYPKKRHLSTTPHSLKKHEHKISDKNKGYFDTNNPEMKYVMNYLTNKSPCSMFQVQKEQYQYRNNNKKKKAQPTSSYVNLLSNRGTKETKRNKGQLFRGASNRIPVGLDGAHAGGGELSKLSQYVSESNSYQYPMSKNKKENCLENSISTNIHEKITSYLSQENQTYHINSTENNANVYFNNKATINSSVNTKINPINNPKAFFYSLNSNDKGNFNQYKELKKKNPQMITKQCKNNQIVLNKISKEFACDDRLKNKNELTSNSVNHQQQELSNNAMSKHNRYQTQNKILQITNGLMSEFISDESRKYNTIDNNSKSNNKKSQSVNPYNNQITLQSMSDSKLYEIANHYITTDESFNKNKCLTNNTKKKLSKGKTIG